MNVRFHNMKGLNKSSIFIDNYYKDVLLFEILVKM